MKNIDSSLQRLSDADLLSKVRRLAEQERHSTARLVASLVELDARRVYLAEGCSSLFTWCTQVLHLSEHAAYGRIEAARAARRFPLILERLADGSLTLTAVGLLARHLTQENHQEVLEAARHRSKREIEHLVARLDPLPAVASSVQRLPAAKVECSRAPEHAATAAAPLPVSAAQRQAPPPLVRPLAPERYRVQLTISAEAHAALRRAQDLLRHSVPNGDPAVIVERALKLLVEHLEKTKIARRTGVRSTPQSGRRANADPGGEAGDGARARREATAPPPGSKDSRHVPAAVRRAVWARDEGRCAFVGARGRCTERGFLEFHHIVPYADGGGTTVKNIELRCRRHNAYEAERWFGPLLAREAAHGYESTRSGPSRKPADVLRELTWLLDPVGGV